MGTRWTRWLRGRPHDDGGCVDGREDGCVEGSDDGCPLGCDVGCTIRSTDAVSDGCWTTIINTTMIMTKNATNSSDHHRAGLGWLLSSVEGLSEGCMLGCNDGRTTGRLDGLPEGYDHG